MGLRTGRTGAVVQSAVVRGQQRSELLSSINSIYNSQIQLISIKFNYIQLNSIKFNCIPCLTLNQFGASFFVSRFPELVLQVSLPKHNADAELLREVASPNLEAFLW